LRIDIALGGLPVLLPFVERKTRSGGELNNIDNQKKEEVPVEKNKIPELKEKMVYGTGCFYELTKWLIVAVIVVLMINFFVATVFIVDGVSMEPNYHTGEVVVANRWQYLFGKPERYDAVTLKFPGDPDHKKYIKRVIGIPGDTIAIQNGQVSVNNQKIAEPYLSFGTLTLPDMIKTLGPDDYFLMGDNRDNSSDSRIWGVAPSRDLIGKAWVILWPISDFGKVTVYR
jgi:signal peptidase I